LSLIKPLDLAVKIDPLPKLFVTKAENEHAISLLNNINLKGENGHD
jgi:heptosyltransferase-2